MKRGIVLIIGLFLLLVVQSFFVNAANCGGAIACSCNDLLNESRTLTGADTLSACSTAGLRLGASNLVLDCAGRTISSSNGINHGIWQDGATRTNITIKNCVIDGFLNGIYSGTTGFTGTISNNTILNNVDGIELHTNGVTISGNNITNNTVNAINIDSVGTTVVNNSISFYGSDAVGVRLSSATASSIDNNNFTCTLGHSSGPSYCMTLSGSTTEINITNNQFVAENYTQGIDGAVGTNLYQGNTFTIAEQTALEASVNDSIINNIITANGGTAIDGGKTVTDNIITVTGGVDDAIILTSSNATYNNNTITVTANDLIGFRASAAVSNVTFSNSQLIVTGSGGQGIYLVNVDDSSFINNALNITNGPEIEVYGSSTGNSFINTILMGDENFSSSNITGVSIAVNETPPNQGGLYTNVSDFLTITNLSATPVINFNLTYSETEFTLVNESTFRLYHYNESTALWEVISTSSVDTVNNVVSSGALTSFSTFAILGNNLCPTISSSYTLTQDVTVNGSCITIAGSNLTLDGAGYTLTGNNSGNAIQFQTGAVQENITLVNFTIQNFGTAITTEAAESDDTSIFIMGNTFTNQSLATINLSSSSVIINNSQFIALTPETVGIDSLGGTNWIIENNTFNYTSVEATTSLLQLTAFNDSSLLRNTFYQGNASSIHLTNSQNTTLQENTFVASEAFENLFLENTNQSTINNNTFNISTIAFQDACDNLILNNHLFNTSFTDNSSTSCQSNFIYNNSFGQVVWIDASAQGLRGNLTFTASELGLGTNLFIGNNTLALNTSALTGNINSSANISLYGLDIVTFDQVFSIEGYETNPENIASGGANCNGTTCTILSFAGNTATFNTTSFSSFTAVGQEATPPSVIPTSPAYGAIVIPPTTIEIAANATDKSGVSSVQANITYPNGTIDTLSLTFQSNAKYNASFTVPNIIGIFNITFIANDTFNSLNSTETIQFSTATEIIISTPANYAALGNNSVPVNLSGNATDPFNLTGLTVAINGTPLTGPTLSPSLPNQTTDWNTTWNPGTSGPYTLVVNISNVYDAVLNTTYDLYYSSDSIIINSTCVECTISGSTITNSALTNSSSVNSTLLGATLVETDVINSPATVINSQLYQVLVVNSTINNSIINVSNITNANIQNLTILGANVTGDYCYSGNVTYNGLTYLCPMNLSQIYAQCGDIANTCQAFESCSTCSADCGACSSSSSSGGGGGSSSGGGGGGVSACTDNADCENSDLYCQGNSVFQQVGLCNNAGTVSAQCSLGEATEIETCNLGCSAGACLQGPIIPDERKDPEKTKLCPLGANFIGETCVCPAGLIISSKGCFPPQNTSIKREETITEVYTEEKVLPTTFRRVFSSGLFGATGSLEVDSSGIGIVPESVYQRALEFTYNDESFALITEQQGAQLDLYIMTKEQSPINCLELKINQHPATLVVDQYDLGTLDGTPRFIRQRFKITSLVLEDALREQLATIAAEPVIC